MALLDALPDAAPVTAIQRIPRGWGNESFVVATAIGTLVAKVALATTPAEKYRASAGALSLARSAGVSAPELLAFVDSVGSLDGRMLRVFRYLAGDTPQIETAPLPLYFELGATLRRLHSVEVSSFTSRLGTEGFPRWSQFLDHRWQAVLDRASQAEFDVDLVVRAHAESVALSNAVDDVVAPALCHRDLYLDNVLVDEAGSLVALLDFDNVEVWDPVVDFFKLEWFVFEPNPAAREPFLDGYLAGDPMPTMFDERVRLVSIVELLNHAANWHVQGQPEIAAEALGRLRALVADVA